MYQQINNNKKIINSDDKLKRSLKLQIHSILVFYPNLHKFIYKMRIRWKRIKYLTILVLVLLHSLDK